MAIRVICFAYSAGVMVLQARNFRIAPVARLAHQSAIRAGNLPPSSSTLSLVGSEIDFNWSLC